MATKANASAKLVSIAAARSAKRKVALELYYDKRFDEYIDREAKQKYQTSVKGKIF